MILVVDIGNTNTVCGVFDNDLLKAKFRLQSIHEKTTDEYAIALLTLLEKNNIIIKEIEGAIISSVVPRLTHTFSRVIYKYLNVESLIVSSNLKTGLKINIDNPLELGADRIVNSVATLEKYGYPALTIDLGTATTIDVLDNDGAYIGGVISPGLLLSSSILHSATAKLPEVSLKKPDSVIGRNTIHCIQSGIYFGYLEMVNGLIARIVRDYFKDNYPYIVVTGGLGEEISNDMAKNAIYEPNLTLEGLLLIYKKNMLKL